jgi:hypothetical protein
MEESAAFTSIRLLIVQFPPGTWDMHSPGLKLHSIYGDDNGDGVLQGELNSTVSSLADQQ